jgi:hypothetical protein
MSMTVQLSGASGIRAAGLGLGDETRLSAGKLASAPCGVHAAGRLALTLKLDATGRLELEHGLDATVGIDAGHCAASVPGVPGYSVWTAL